MESEASPCVLVYDVGGSHISAALCYAESYRLSPVVKTNLPDSQTSDAFVDVLYSIGRQASAGNDSPAGAELAMPGPFDYSEGISRMRHKLPYLYGVNMSQALSGRFGWASDRVRFLNDAAAYLLGEVGAGAARGVNRAVGITLGTGVGSAFSVDGRIVTQGAGVPPGGEIWNVRYQGGIVEDQISTRAIQSAYLERSGKEREVASIAHYAVGGEPVAIEVFADFGRNLGLVLKTLIAEFAPDVVVLGGGISRSAFLFLPMALQELSGLNVQLRVSALGDDAPLGGCRSRVVLKPRHSHRQRPSRRHRRLREIKKKGAPMFLARRPPLGEFAPLFAALSGLRLHFRLHRKRVDHFAGLGVVEFFARFMLDRTRIGLEPLNVLPQVGVFLFQFLNLHAQLLILRSLLMPH